MVAVSNKTPFVTTLLTVRMAVMNLNTATAICLEYKMWDGIIDCQESSDEKECEDKKQFRMHNPMLNIGWNTTQVTHTE